jgi:hypothetical protein
MEAGKVAGGGWVLAGRSDLTKVSLSAVNQEGERTLKVTATAPVKLVPLGDVVDGTAHFAVVLGGKGPTEVSDTVNAAAAVLHLEDANRPRILVKGGEVFAPYTTGWFADGALMIANSYSGGLFVMAKLADQQKKGLGASFGGDSISVSGVQEPAGPFRTYGGKDGTPVIASLWIPHGSIGVGCGAVRVKFGGNSVEIPTDQAPDNVVPDFSRAERMILV